MRNFQDTFETRKRSFISAFSICVNVNLNEIASLLFYLMCDWRENLIA